MKHEHIIIYVDKINDTYNFKLELISLLQQYDNVHGFIELIN